MGGDDAQQCSIFWAKEAALDTSRQPPQGNAPCPFGVANRKSIAIPDGHVDFSCTSQPEAAQM